MPRRTDISKIGLLMVVTVAAFAGAQTVMSPWEVPCSKEKVHPNLEVKVKQRISGELKDQSGAAFGLSQVQLRTAKGSDKFIPYRTVTTDREGHFDLGLVDPGRYRFLPSPSRAFKQPKQVDCFEGEACELQLALEANPTDQTFVGCPIQ
jgi:hypothetical protein